MRKRVFRSLALAVAATALGSVMGLVPGSAQAGGPIGILVLKEHGIGSAAQAQPYVDKLVTVTATLNQWSGGAKGEYHTTRDGAKGFISSADPHYGIFSLAAFLGLRETYKLEVVGQALVSRAGGQQYFIVSKDAGDLAGCKGKTLATDHGDDTRFIDGVVARGAFRLADFTLVPTKRPLQTIKKVVSGDAVCALIDDAQNSELGKIEGAGNVKVVWTSDKLPPMVIAAFPSAPSAEKKTFQTNLPKVCEGDGKSACSEVGMQALRSAGQGDYQKAIDAYR
jgi:hypothetical protein